MKKTILYPHLFACLSLFFFWTGCEREEIVSERIALNALEVQLGVITRASSDGDDPTLATPNSRRNWVLEVHIEGSHAEDYVFSEQDEVWIPKSSPVYFPAGINNDACNVTFTLRPPTSSNTTIGQDGSKAGLLEADTLKSAIKMRPQENYLVSLVHTNSLIEIVFEQSLKNRDIEIALQGNHIHPYAIDHKRYLCIVPGGSNNITLTTKAEGAERQYALDVDFGTKSNTRYVFTVTYLLPTFYSDVVIHSPIISPWSDTTGDDAIFDGDNAGDNAKEFIHIEGYTSTIALMVSDTLVWIYPHPNSKAEEGIYYFPSAILKNKIINSLLLEKYSKNILIGRNTNDINPINLKVDSNGKLLLRKAQDGNILINTVDEILLVNTNLESNYKQEADIDLSCISQRSWEPIGNFESPFKGTYDGNGYAIHSLNMDIKQFTAWNPDHLAEEDFNILTPHLKEYYWMLPAGAVGLFGVNQGTITNVHIASGTMSVSEIKRENMKSIALGAICGYNDEGYITSCTNKAELKVHTISGDNGIYDVFTVGGICGTSRGNIEYSINYGDIIAEKGSFMKLLIGGICGSLYSRYETDKVKINSCINHGNVLFNDHLSDMSRTEVCCFGGILGLMCYNNANRDSLSETIQHISNCYNTGNITNRGTTEIYGKFSGVVAEMFFPYSTYSCKISSCYNIGQIKVEFIATKILLDPILCKIFEFPELSLPFELLVENCFYNATTWKEVRSDTNWYYDFYSWNGETFAELLEYRDTANKKILESTPGFSLYSWPNPDIWDTNVWGNLGSWNEGNPIYPKLRFEKD
ncbi:hypothetical protein EZS27_009670 [termite gut metagenome]|uniref:GLUG domain-containing protein n=1 Tax=termite gut metagenome TaxID=433724 RepID=A0A5J4SBA7_9ZZZZ